MRAVNLCGLTILGVALVVIAPAVTNGQFQPGGGRGNMGGGFGQDPNVLFDFLAKGRTFFLISETRSFNAPLTQFAQERGISSGQITRQQFLDFQDWRAKQNLTIGGGKPFGGFGKKGGFEGMMPAPGVSPQGIPPNPDLINQLAEAEFRMRDRNGDGRLNQEEMPGSVRNNMAKWDKNSDGLTDLGEFKEYYAAKMLGNDDPSTTKGIASIIIEEEDLDRRPVVFRAGGKTPTGLPAWFKELDTDGDGQAALYEWRKTGKPMDEFANWDLNGDGFITPEEAIRQQSVIAKSTPSKTGSGSMATSSEEGEGKMRRPWFGKGGGDSGSGKSSKGGKKKDSSN